MWKVELTENSDFMSAFNVCFTKQLILFPVGQWTHLLMYDRNRFKQFLFYRRIFHEKHSFRAFF